MNKSLAWKITAVSLAVLMTACGGGGGSGTSSGGDIATPVSPPPPSPPPASPPPPPPPATQGDSGFSTPESTSRFLTQATFGPTTEDLDTFTGTSASQWLVNEFAKPASLNVAWVTNFLEVPGSRGDEGLVNDRGAEGPTHSFWINAITGDDQLRQRVTFALSQIIVVSHHDSSSSTFRRPITVAYYQDILTRNAFGNYRELLEEITYSPAMAYYLTYFRNQKEDPYSHRMPDENYAREIMQLFTIGLNELNHDGTLKLGADGQPIPTFDNDDVSGLAKVFTGLAPDTGDFDQYNTGIPQAYEARPLVVYPAYHSSSEKTFLGTTIPAGTSGEESIKIALDTLFQHPNMGPFLSRQMIQRLVTSNPSPAYVGRVATAFETGQYTLPDGTSVGDGRRGSMEAMVAAILMDAEARSDEMLAFDTFGKVREPAIRFAQWARAFDASAVTPEDSFNPYDETTDMTLGQIPYQAASVFNFYRPGYVPPGSESGAAGMTVPELQITNSSTLVGYANFMAHFTFAKALQGNQAHSTSFIPDYTEERALANDPAALVDHLDTLLASSQLTDATKNNIVQAIDAIPLTNENIYRYDGPLERIGTAVLMVMTSPEYLVQR
ncbi:DUF1800 family protein [Hyphomonas sp. CY54-11-8]|uniref:DUF1800 domain-containing protein n=2 Tax=unclassified Hyphomonas TaxID=2630699 RepID=UPI0005573E0C|nr:DUF1800 family protein [Hyphomonas sp. CY54-11-8]